MLSSESVLDNREMFICNTVRNMWLYFIHGKSESGFLGVQTKLLGINHAGSPCFLKIVLFFSNFLTLSKN